MPTDLPTTVIGLIAFIVLLAGWLLYRMFEGSNERSIANVAQFVTYIEKKNGIVERLGDKYTKATEDQQLRFEKALTDQAAAHKEMLGDFAARLESTLPLKANRRSRA